MSSMLSFMVLDSLVYLWFIVSLFRLCQLTDYFNFGHNPKLYLLHVFLLIFGICYCIVYVVKYMYIWYSLK